MKIAFLEYQHTLCAIHGDTNLMLAWYELLSECNQIDLVQYSPNCIIDKKEQTHFYEIKMCSNVDLNSYDVVIINNIYLSRQNSTQEFFDYIYSLKVKTLFVDHIRSSLNPFINGLCGYALGQVTDFTFTYFKNLRSVFMDPKKLLEIRPCHFYKPVEFEGQSPKTTDFVYLNRPIAEKGVFKMLDFLELFQREVHTPNAQIHGWMGAIQYLPVKEHKLIEQHISKKGIIKKNTERSFVELYGKVIERHKIGKILNSSKISWNCYDHDRKRHQIMQFMDNGLESTPLESLLYGCVPIVHNITKTCPISYDANDISKTIPLEELDCCLFTDNTDFHDLLVSVENELKYRNKFSNTSKMITILRDKTIYRRAMMDVLDHVVSTNSSREHTTTSALKDMISANDLLTRVGNTNTNNIDEFGIDKFF